MTLYSRMRCHSPFLPTFSILLARLLQPPIFTYRYTSAVGSHHVRVPSADLFFSPALVQNQGYVSNAFPEYPALGGFRGPSVPDASSPVRWHDNLPFILDPLRSIPQVKIDQHTTYGHL